LYNKPYTYAYTHNIVLQPKYLDTNTGTYIVIYIAINTYLDGLVLWIEIQNVRSTYIHRYRYRER
jgi:hypothetical protein